MAFISKIMEEYQKRRQQGYVDKSMKEDTESYLRFDHGENRKGMSPEMLRSLQRLDLLNVLSHYPTPSYYGLRKEIGSWYGLSPKQVSVGAGLNEIIERIARLVLAPGDPVCTIEPGFYRFQDACLRQGARTQQVLLAAEEGFGLSPRVEKEILALKPKLLWICNPNNPTGTVTSRDAIARLIEKLPDTLVIVDEAYGEYVEDWERRSALTLLPAENLLVLRTFSKLYGLAGLIAGYALGCEELISALEAIRLEFPVSGIAEQLLPKIWSSREYFIEVARKIRAERDALLKSIASLDDYEVCPSETNIFLLRHKTKQLYDELKRKGILVADMNTCAGIEGERFVRVTVQPDSSANMRLLEALREVA